VWYRSIASGLAATGTAVSAGRPVGPGRSLSSDEPTTPMQSASADLKPSLSSVELSTKILSILEEYLHICDIQVLLVITV